MSAFEVRANGPERCFLPERRYFLAVLCALRETFGADSGEQCEKSRLELAEGLFESDDDIEEATRIAMLAELSGAEAESLAIAVRELGAESAVEVVNGLRVAYASCVRELHAHGRAEVTEDLLSELALQLVDPIRSVPTPVAAFATAKILVELLSHAGIELDAWPAPLWIRVLHPHSRVGASKALRSLVADHRAAREYLSFKRSVELESQSELKKRSGSKGKEVDRKAVARKNRAG